MSDTPMIGDEVDVAGYTYTIWSAAPGAGKFHAYREAMGGSRVWAVIARKTDKGGRRWAVVKPSQEPKPKAGAPSEYDVPMVELPNTNPKVVSRRDDPSTSKRAAVNAMYRSGTHKALILAAHGRNRAGLTDEETSPASGLTYHQAERRCCDLRNEGMLTILKDADGNEVERQGTSGSFMRVSVLTDLGIATLASMKEPHAHQPDPDPDPDRTHDLDGEYVHTCHPSGISYSDDCNACLYERSTGKHLHSGPLSSTCPVCGESR